MLLLLVILGGELEARLTDDAPTLVELTYRLRDVEEPELSFTLLEARGATVSKLRVDGRDVVLDRTDAPLLRGRVPIASDATTLSFSYEVAGNTLPVAVLEGGFENDTDGAFRAVLSLPEGRYLAESFPTGLVSEGERHLLTLPIAPAFIALDVRPEPPLAPLPVVLDALAVVLLVGLALYAVRRR